MKLKKARRKIAALLDNERFKLEHGITVDYDGRRSETCTVFTEGDIYLQNYFPILSDSKWKDVIRKLRKGLELRKALYGERYEL